MKISVLIIGLTVVVIGFTAYTSIKEIQDEKAIKTQAESSKTTNQATAFLVEPFSVGSANTANTALFYDVKGNYKRAITKDKLTDANLLDDLIPFYPVNWISDYQSVEISTDLKGQKIKSVSKNNVLNSEQKNILRTAVLESEIEISVGYRSENAVTGEPNNREMKLTLTVIPEKEAEYTGGFPRVIEYLKTNSHNKVSGLNPATFQNASILFTVNETGNIADVTLVKTSGYTEIDNLLIELIGEMPAWKPAENANGSKVKQEFAFAFGPSGC